MFLGIMSDLLKNVIEGKMIGKPARGRKRLNTLSDLAKTKVCGTQKTSQRQNRVAEIEKSRRAEQSHFMTAVSLIIM